MKKYIAILLVSLVVVFASCDLDTAPTGSAAAGDVFATTQTAQTAVNGLARLMVSQYLGTQQLNGEGSIMHLYGDLGGNNLIMDNTGWAVFINRTFIDNVTSTWLWYPWAYYYRIIGDANAILDNIGRAEGQEFERQHIRAQALVYRAYAFFMLSQFYSARWMDSSNGASQGLILRLNAVTPNDMPFSTLAETYAQIYADLERAISYFSIPEVARIPRQNRAQMNIDVARAVFARAALTRQDWARAAEMAAAARANFPLMSNDDMMAGFNRPTSEWIWGSYGSEAQNIFFFSFGATMGFNADAAIVRGFPRMITRELFEQIPETDIRRGWWQVTDLPGFSPGARGDIVRTGGRLAIPAAMTYTQFDEALYTWFNTWFTGLDAADVPERPVRPAHMTNRNPIAGTDNIGFAAWFTNWFDGWLNPIFNAFEARVRRDFPGLTTAHTVASHMQTKIGVFAQPGVGHIPHFRSSEMILIEAEARARMGEDVAAQNLLLALNRDSGRNPAYTVTYTGQDLLNEIWLYRDIELWGEGFNWFDLKRTGRPITRRSKAAGGSFLPALAISVAPTGENNWILATPQRETDFNRATNPPLPES